MKNKSQIKNNKGLTLVEMLLSLVIFAIASIFLISIFISAIVVNKKTLENIVENALFRMVNEYAVASINLDTPIEVYNSDPKTEFIPSTITTNDGEDESPKLSMQSQALKAYFTILKNNKSAESDESDEINMDTFKMYSDHYFKIKLIDVSKQIGETEIEGQKVYTYVVALYHKDDANKPVRSIQIRMHKKDSLAGP